MLALFCCLESKLKYAYNKIWNWKTAHIFFCSFVKGAIAAGYMDWYISIMGDHSPESSRILLPVGITLTDIYKEYCGVNPIEEQVGYQRFHQIWKENHQNVSYQRVCSQSLNSNYTPWEKFSKNLRHSALFLDLFSDLQNVQVRGLRSGTTHSSAGSPSRWQACSRIRPAGTPHKNSVSIAPQRIYQTIRFEKRVGLTVDINIIGPKQTGASKLLLSTEWRCC